jgi:hypothetical protein
VLTKDLPLRTALGFVRHGDPADPEGQLLLALRRGYLRAWAEVYIEMDRSTERAGPPQYNYALPPGFWIEAAREKAIEWEAGRAGFGSSDEGGSTRCTGAGLASEIYVSFDDFVALFDIKDLLDDTYVDDDVVLADRCREWTTAAEQAAHKHVRNMVQAAGEHRMRKRDAFEALLQQFPQMPERAFNRVWSEEAPPAWRRPGRKGKQT